MSRFVKTLALFVAGLQLAPAKAVTTQTDAPRLLSDDDMKGVSLQPLNGKFDNLFAGHASHSSHRSHASHSSHYSGSSGYASPYVAPAPTPVPAPVPSAMPLPTSAAEPVRPLQTQGSTPAVSGSATSSGGQGTATSTPTAGTKLSRSVPVGGQAPASELPMTLAEKRRLQLIRVQIRLHALGLFDGQISGSLDPETGAALKLFQKVKNLPESGQMTTPTLNALGIPAVK